LGAVYPFAHQTRRESQGWPVKVAVPAGWARKPAVPGTGSCARRKVMAELRHPALVRLARHGRGGTGLPFLVMEFVEGGEARPRF